ncbi:MAG TPA: aldo/keto reductase [Vicinamibacterales bacterium]|jgi:aryl-alcohol dehydrogenase-like predicted oxidoreductase/enamine deaminase RidA (YjgF/YER057c/UK114 family)
MTSKTSIVERRTLSPTLSISRVLTGLWQLADMERDGKLLDLDRAAAAMAAYVDAGLTTFDMADHYGSAELVAGRFRSRHHDSPIQLFTKWVPKPGRTTKAAVREAVERSLTRLGVDSIDLLQYHAWNYADPAWLETLFELQDLKTKGLVRHLGLTNVDTAHLHVVVASGIEVVSNQVSFSLLDQRAAGSLAPFCAAHDVRLLAYGTLAGGWLTERWHGAPEPDWDHLPTWSLMKYGRFLRVAGGWTALQRVLDAVASVARRHQASFANVASRYILDQPGVAGVIIGARLGEREHIADTLRLFSLQLTDVDRADIHGALTTLQAIPGDCGDEYRKPPFLTASGDLSHHLESMPAPYEAVPRDDGRTLCLSGTSWERIAGFARAVRQGSRIHVSGTTATLGDRVVGGRDPTAQTHFVIDKIEGALQTLGARLDDVIRTRVYVRNMADWEAVARAHGARFAAIQPANTLVAAALVGDEYLVEIEAEAEVAK